MSRLYINEPAAKIGIKDGRFTITSKDGAQRSLPFESVDGICVFGPVFVSAQCIAECLKNDIDIQYYSSGGSYHGRIASTSRVNTACQRKQAVLDQSSEFCINITKRVIKAKIHNQIVQVRRYGRERTADTSAAITAMQNCEQKIDHCSALPEILGYEGSAAREYFKALGQLIEPDFRFDKRSKRPPLDPFNSMLSLGYAILLHAVYGAIENKGLNPYFGFLHADRENHPALAGDLMEEWRAVIVDAVCMAMVNGHEIHCDDFHTLPDKPGIFLGKDAFKAFVTKLERKFNTDQKYLVYIEYPVSFRRAIDLQVQQYVRAIESERADIYAPVIIR